MFLLVPAHLGSPGQNPESHKTVVVVVVVATMVMVVVVRYMCFIKEILCCSVDLLLKRIKTDFIQCLWQCGCWE